MIIESSPQWIQELSRVIHFKNLVILHGNVLDLVSFPIELDADGANKWSHGNRVASFLKRFLAAQGYGVVSVIDPSHGMSFGNQDMETRFSEIVQATCNESGEQVLGALQQSRSSAGQEDGQSDQTESEPVSRRAMPYVARALANTEHSCAFVYDLASRLVASPSALDDNELDFFTRVQCASRDATQVRSDGTTLNNVLILTCEEPENLPAFLYANNPHARSIALDRPSRTERSTFFADIYRGYYAADKDTRPTQEQRSRFAALTEGWTYTDMGSLTKLSHQDELPVTALDTLIERFKYGVKKSPWDDAELKQRLRSAHDLLRRRVKGQDAAVARTVDIVKRAHLGMAAGASSQSQRPRGVMFLAGPTGVGKTELAKALAELLFGNEDQCVRFDMSEYASEHSDQRLLGSPPGYVGHSEGGQLTSRVKENPFRVLLFDEIEKANSRIFDKFLQILDDGRLTDGRGDTVYFSQSVIVFTSNLGTAQSDHQVSGSDNQAMSAEMPYDQIRERILGYISHHFRSVLQRPEILNRFGDNFVVFDYIRTPLDKEIVDLLLDQARRQLREKHDIELTLTEFARGQLVEIARGQLEHGGRGIRNALDTAVIDPLARWLFDQNIDTLTEVQVEAIRDQGIDAPLRYELAIG